MTSMPILQPIPSEIRLKTPFVRYLFWIQYRRRWQVMEDWSYEFKGKKIVIPKGFVFDGVSIPKFFHWFLSPTGVLFIPGLIHDFAYRYGYIWIIDEMGVPAKFQEASSRHFWDAMFKELGLELNQMVLLNYFSRFILFSFGWYSWEQNRKKPLHELKPKDLM